MMSLNMLIEFGDASTSLALISPDGVARLASRRPRSCRQGPQVPGIMASG
jgi:hypothetical protein